MAHAIGHGICHWLLKSMVVAFANLESRLGNCWRSRTLLFLILLNCSIRGQLFLRTIVLDHPRLIRSHLICCHRVRMWCWLPTDPCTQLDAIVIRPNNSTAHVFQVHWCIKRVNMQCVCWTPFIRATINSPSESWLFMFGSTETAQKDACCVQMLDTRPKLHAYAKLNRASSVQCIVCSDHLLFKRPSFIQQWRWAQGQKLRSRYGAKKPINILHIKKPWVGLRYRVSILCHQRE